MAIYMVCNIFLFFFFNSPSELTFWITYVQIIHNKHTCTNNSIFTNLINDRRFSSPKCLDHLWGPASLLFTNWRCFLGNKAGGSMKLTTHFHLVQKLRSGGAIPVLVAYAFMANELCSSLSAARYCVFTVYGQSSGLVSKNRSPTGQTHCEYYMTEKSNEWWDKYISYIQTSIIVWYSGIR